MKMENEYYQLIRANEIHTNVRFPKKFKTKTDYLNIITIEQRDDLMQWLIETHLKLDCKNEYTLHLSVDLLDRVLSECSIHASIHGHFFTMAAVCLFLAMKIEEKGVVRIKDLKKMVPSPKFTKKEFLKLERDILSVLKYDCTSLMPYDFLSKYLEESKYDAFPELYFIRETYFTQYIVELTSIDYALMHIIPSARCASALYLARLHLYGYTHKLVFNDKDKQWVRKEFVYKNKLWHEKLFDATLYKPNELRDIITRMLHCLREAHTKYPVIVNKYSTSERKYVSGITCLNFDQLYFEV